MDAITTTSDSPTTDDSVVTKGFTQIALGAAAGALVAMRMNRGALLLAAGLAYAYWKKNQPALSDDSVLEPVITEDLAPLVSTAEFSSDKGASVWQAPEAPVQKPFQWTIRPAESEPNLLPSAPLQPFFTPPVAPLEPVLELEKEHAPVESAWADLRAAIAPAITAPLEEKTESQVPLNVSVGIAEKDLAVESVVFDAPPMVDMDVCLPSAPMVLPTMDETDVLPGDMLMIEQAEPVAEETAQSLFFEAPSEFIQTPQSLRVTETLIVPKPITQPLISEETPQETSFSAPVVVPRDLQARKSFFDWLRG